MPQPGSPQEFAAELSRMQQELDDTLSSNTISAWLERLTMPRPIFDALDAYTAAFSDQEPMADPRQIRGAWLRIAIENWHTSLDYRHDADQPVTPLNQSQREEYRRMQAVRMDPSRGTEAMRFHKDITRLEWLMAIAREPNEAPNSFVLPSIPVRYAMDEYFSANSRQLELPVDGNPPLPYYPNLELASETVLRASMAAYAPTAPTSVQWSDGLPIPVQAALNTLR